MRSTFYFLFILLIGCNHKLNKIKNDKVSFITPESCGAMADGITDDSKAFLNAIKKLKPNGTLLLANRSYFIQNYLGETSKSINIEGKLLTKIICPDGFLSFINTPNIERYQINNFFEGSRILNLKNASTNIKKGNLAFFYSDELFEEKVVPYRKEHSNIIKGIEGTQIAFEYPIGFSFKNTVTIKFYDKKSIFIKNIKFVADNPLYIISVFHYSDVKLDNVTFTTRGKRLYGIFPSVNLIGTSGIALYGCTKIKAYECKFDNLWYGLMAHRGCTDIVMEKCSAFRSHHINNSALGTDLFIIKDCETSECEGGYDSHETSMSLTLIRCKDIKGRYATILRGRRDKVIDSYFGSGIEMKYDPNSLQLFEEDIVGKSFINSISDGSINIFEGANIIIKDSKFSQSVVFAKNYGQLQILNSEFNEKDVSIPLRSEVLTIGDIGWNNEPYSFYMKDCIIKSALPSKYPMGLYIPMTGKVKGELVNIVIDGFSKGLTLYGGFPALKYYKDLVLSNITIKNSNIGIYQTPYDIIIKRMDIKFINCNQNVDKIYSITPLSK